MPCAIPVSQLSVAELFFHIYLGFINSWSVLNIAQSKSHSELLDEKLTVIDYKPLIPNPVTNCFYYPLLMNDSLHLLCAAWGNIAVTYGKREKCRLLTVS